MATTTTLPILSRSDAEGTWHVWGDAGPLAHPRLANWLTGFDDLEDDSALD